MRQPFVDISDISQRPEVVFEALCRFGRWRGLPDPVEQLESLGDAALFVAAHLRLDARGGAFSFLVYGPA